MKEVENGIKKDFYAFKKIPITNDMSLEEIIETMSKADLALTHWNDSIDGKRDISILKDDDEIFNPETRGALVLNSAIYKKSKEEENGSNEG